MERTEWTVGGPERFVLDLVRVVGATGDRYDLRQRTRGHFPTDR